MTHDAVVVGSGFGGAVTAARLAERGLRVLILERGPWWGAPGGGDPASADRRPFPRGAGFARVLRNVRIARRGRRRETVLRRDGLLELHVFDRLTAITGSGVGGGSLVYTALQVAPEPAYFDAYPAELTADELAPSFDRVREILHPRPVPERQRPPKTHLLGEAIREAGRGPITHPALAIEWGPDPDRPRVAPNAAGVEQSSCIHCGECVLGCMHRAKSSLDLTFLPLAMRHGAELRSLAEVTSIAQVPGATPGRWRVTYVDHRDGRTCEATGDRLVLAAGTLNTLRLLFAARDRHRTLARPLPPARSALLAQRRRGRSPPGVPGPRPIRPGPELRRLRGAAPGGAVRLPRRPGRGSPPAPYPCPASLRDRLDRSIALFAMGRDASVGRVGFDGEGLVTDLGRDVDDRIFDAIETTMHELAPRYGPRKAYVPWPVRGPKLATVHAQGGASIGSTPENGVVDHRGEVFGYPGLHVADASLFPRAPGVPPSLTIAALPDRQAGLIS